MEFAATIARVHRALEQLDTDCAMEDVVTLCPGLTWNQAFLAIDSLSRAGQIRVTLADGRTYKVQAHHAVMDATVPAPATPA